MDDTLRWFGCLVIEHQLLDDATLRQIQESLPADADAAAYGEMMLDLGITEDVERLQRLLDEAVEQSDAGKSIPFDAFAAPRRRPISLRNFTPLASTEAESPAPPPEPPESAPPAEEVADEVDPPPSDSSAEAPHLVDEALVKVGTVTPRYPDFDALADANPAAVRDAVIGLLLETTQSGASDLHLSAGTRPFVRKDRVMEFIGEKPLGAKVAAALNTALLTPTQRAEFEASHDFDFALALDTGHRYRCNLMLHKDGVAGTYRTVATKVRSLAQLGFHNAEAITKLLAFHNGLIMVAGPVGSGKTTTLAALIHELNSTREDHLITVEEPIEMVHPSRRCSITQRGVGSHTRSFQSALKGALRQDPDIIVIGEMRDLETVEMAISASETGHLVIGTMHTSDAATTLNRLLDVFPPAQQSQIRAMVAESLRGIICQRLLPARRGGVVLAYELLLRNLAVSALIREGKSQGLANIMETGKADGMVLMDNSVMDLWRGGRISDQVALANLVSEINRREIRGVSSASASSFAAGAPELPKKRKLF